MISRVATPPQPLNWARAFSILMLLALAMAFAAPTQATIPAPRAQADLLALAAEHPTTQVAVIVQKQARDASVERLVVQLGGNITADLHIINAFAARLPAGAVLELARSASVRWVSLDAPVVRSTACAPCVASTNLKNAYIRAIGADRVWNESPYLQGQGIGVAVVDSGVNPQQDLYTVMGVNRLVASAAFNGGYNQSVYDGYGHGNHVGGIIAGNGSRSNGAYIGVAPMSNLINVKVSDDSGAATA